MRKGEKMKENFTGGKAESFGANFIDRQKKSSCYMSLTELI